MALKTAPADGYTVGVLVSGNAVQPWIRKDLPFDIRADLAPLTRLYYSPKAMIEGGRLRVLAVTSAKRMSLLPQVPMIGETYPGFDVVAWTGFAAPAGTPRDVVEKLAGEIRAILLSADVKKRLLEMGVEPGGESPAEFAQMIAENYEKFGRAIKAAGINQAGVAAIRESMDLRRPNRNPTDGWLEKSPHSA